MKVHTSAGEAEGFLQPLTAQLGLLHILHAPAGKGCIAGGPASAAHGQANADTLGERTGGNPHPQQAKVDDLHDCQRDNVHLSHLLVSSSQALAGNQTFAFVCSCSFSLPKYYFSHHCD